MPCPSPAGGRCSHIWMGEVSPPHPTLCLPGPYPIAGRSIDSYSATSALVWLREPDGFSLRDALHRSLKWTGCKLPQADRVLDIRPSRMGKGAATWQIQVGFWEKGHVGQG